MFRLFFYKLFVISGLGLIWWEQNKLPQYISKPAARAEQTAQLPLVDSYPPASQGDINGQSLELLEEPLILVGFLSITSENPGP